MYYTIQYYIDFIDDTGVLSCGRCIISYNTYNL